MEGPVVAADGFSYERSAIEQWLRRSVRSPMTNAPLGSAGLIPNIALRKAIAEWRAHRPLALDPAALTVSSDVLGVGSFGTVVAGTLKTGAREQRVAVFLGPHWRQRRQRCAAPAAPCALAPDQGLEPVEARPSRRRRRRRNKFATMLSVVFQNIGPHRNKEGTMKSLCLVR